MNSHIVFDLDWTIADTQKIHEQIESDFLQRKWLFIDPKEIWARFAWRTPQEWIREVLLENQIAFDDIELESFVEYKDTTVISLLKDWKIELMPYALEIMDELYKAWYKIGISSGACREFIDEFLKYFKLANIVNSTTSSNEVINKKPNPDVFLSSFKKIEDEFWKPAEKYVIWDWWSDVEWWYRSWAKTIWLNYGCKAKRNEQYCNHEIKDLNDLREILIINK